MFEWITDPNSWLVLGTLTILEIILGVDNVIFLSLLVAKLPKSQQNKASRIGLSAAMLIRLILLSSIAWIMDLKNELFTFAEHAISTCALIFFFGGLFLIWKSTKEIYNLIFGNSNYHSSSVSSFTSSVIQIMLLDIICSLDSVITAVGLSDQLFIMITAVIVSFDIMIFAARPIVEFINTYPSVKILALSFLILVGLNLILESIQIKIPKGYIYFSMFFSTSVESLNWLRSRKKDK